LKKCSSLDPENWDDFRCLAHETLDAALDYVARVRERPVWSPVPEQVKQELDKFAPAEGKGAEATIDAVRRLILPYATGNVHPGFCG